VGNTEPSDALERDRFREMLESDAFRRYTARVSRELVRVMDDCHNLDEPRDIYRAQGAAKMVEAILILPARILAEMEPKKKP